MYREVTVEAAERGAELLDRRSPGWEQRIDLALLDVGSPHACVLGQLYGSYCGGVQAILGEATTERRVDYGFSLGTAEGRDAYGPLTAAWRGLIEGRRANHGS